MEIPTEEEDRGLIPHLAGNVTSIFLMQVSGWLDDFPSAVLWSPGFPLNVFEGFRQKQIQISEYRKKIPNMPRNLAEIFVRQLAILE
jgi:hypothetical protein